MSGSPATSEVIFLVFAASRLMALSKASGPSRSPPLIWPRSAILQSAAASSVAGIFELTVSTAARMATFGRSTPNVRARSIAFWQMSTLSSSVGAMLIAPSVTMRTLWYVGTSMRKTWLSRRPVLRPVSFAITAPRISSECRLPFMTSSASPVRTSSTAFAAAARLSGTSTIFASPRAIPAAFATSAIFAAGPTRIGVMSPILPASIAPARAVSSQG
jgi:hypothetical protein